MFTIEILTDQFLLGDEVSKDSTILITELARKVHDPINAKALVIDYLLKRFTDTR
jgi:hypothetical protein